MKSKVIVALPFKIEKLLNEFLSENPEIEIVELNQTVSTQEHMSVIIIYKEPDKKENPVLDLRRFYRGDGVMPMGEIVFISQDEKTFHPVKVVSHGGDHLIVERKDLLGNERNVKTYVFYFVDFVNKTHKVQFNNGRVDVTPTKHNIQLTSFYK